MGKGTFIDQPEKRKLFGELLKTLDEKAAIKELKLGKTPGRTIATWKKRGLYPYDTPDVVQVNDIVVQPVAQMNDSVVQPTVVQVNDTVVNEILARLDALEAQVKSSSSVARIVRPRLKRTQEDTVPTSFRFPSALVKRARAKAKKDRTTLNALVETFLFEYVGCPGDLLEE